MKIIGLFLSQFLRQFLNQLSQFLSLFLNPLRRRGGVLFLSPEDMQEAKKSMKEKGIKAEDVKNLPSIEGIHGFDTSPPRRAVEVNSLMKFNNNDNPHNMHPNQCLYEFENYIRKQDHFNANVMKQLI